MKRTLLVALVLLVAVGGFGVWWFLVRDDTPPEASLPDRSTETTDVGGEPRQAGTPDGEWAVATSEETYAGFRIAEQFPGIDNTAVVRTPAVEGRLVIAGPSITEVEISADLTEMESLDSVPPGVPGIENRVGQMRDDGLETDTFPTASFVLAEPIELGAVPAEGEVVTAEALGDLTIHGVTQRVTIAVEARWSGEVVDVAGSLEVILADYGMEAPERPFVSVADTGTMEFQLTFE